MKVLLVLEQINEHEVYLQVLLHYTFGEGTLEYPERSIRARWDYNLLLRTHWKVRWRLRKHLNL